MFAAAGSFPYPFYREKCTRMTCQCLQKSTTMCVIFVGFNDKHIIKASNHCNNSIQEWIKNNTKNYEILLLFKNNQN